MGHIRLGILPKYPKWQQITSLLDNPDIGAFDIGDKILINSKKILNEESTVESIGFCVWIIAQLALTSKLPNFQEKLNRLGISVNEKTTAVELISRTSALVAKGLSKHAIQNAITDIAQLSLRESLTKTIGLQTNTLFGVALEDTRLALEKFSTKTKFSELLHIYFSSFVNRTIEFVLDKEISNHLGKALRFTSFNRVNEFKQSISRFSSDTTRIIDEFSGGWYSKRSWEKGAITEKEANGFAHVAIKKIIDDLEISRADK